MGDWLYVFGPVGAILVVSAVNLLGRHLLNDFRHGRSQRNEFSARDQFIASIRLRLPKGAQFVVLQHEIVFNDERYRAAASQIFEENNFKTSTTETYDKHTHFWLLAQRSTMIDHVINEVQAVSQLARKWNGHYENCVPDV